MFEAMKENFKQYYEALKRILKKAENSEFLKVSKLKKDWW